MDLLGDIVEHNTVDPSVPVPPGPLSSSSSSGFPNPVAKKPSRWRQRLQKKGLSSISGVVQPEKDDSKFYTVDKDTNLKKFKDSSERQLDYEGLSQSEQIHQENIEILARMSTQEREDAKQELLDELDPKILQLLMKRSRRKYGDPALAEEHNPAQKNLDDPLYQPVEGSIGTWVGGEHGSDASTQHQQDPPVVDASPSLRSDGKIRPVLKSTSHTDSSVALPADDGKTRSVLKSTSHTDRSVALPADGGNLTGTATTQISTSDSLDAPHLKQTPSGSKKIRFSKEAKVIYLDQSKCVRQKTPTDSEGEWEDFEDVGDSSISPPVPAVDENAAPNIAEALELSKQDNEELIHSSSGIHFPKPTQPYEELDINDPKFNDKLYEKYFPDLPRNQKQLEWMKPTANDKLPKDISYDSVESVRFDFKGNIISNENIDGYLGENQGLFNHSKNPELPGYTLPELGHYLRSTFPGQVCVASRTLGRIMHRLGKLKYQVAEINDVAEKEDINTPVEKQTQTQNLELKGEGVEGNFEIECWKLISELKIIELLQMYASDREKNLSVKNYAIDALWLWKQADGDKKLKQYATTAE